MEVSATAGERVLSGFHNALARPANSLLRLQETRPDPVADFARSVEAGLGRKPRRLESRFLYDARGSELYEEITRQPEYYPTRTEAAILERCADRIRQTTGPVTLLELGSGSSVKTEHLLDAYGKANRPPRYLPIDVSASALQSAIRTLGRRHPEVHVVAIHGTYEEAFPLFRTTSPAMVIFLGSTIGNLDREESDIFLHRLATNLEEGDFFLLGIDLVKERPLLEAAYNDAGGVTAAFTRNLFTRMNRELGCAVEVDQVEHRAGFNPEQNRIEIRACFRSAQTIASPLLPSTFRLAAGDCILTEISRKFRLAEYLPYLERFGFAAREVFTDDNDWFALLLLQKTANPNTTS